MLLYLVNMQCLIDTYNCLILYMYIFTVCLLFSCTVTGHCACVHNRSISGRLNHVANKILKDIKGEYFAAMVW